MVQHKISSRRSKKWQNILYFHICNLMIIIFAVNFIAIWVWKRCHPDQNVFKYQEIVLIFVQKKLPDKFSLLTDKHNFYLVLKAWNIRLTLFQCGKCITRRSFVGGWGQKMLSHAGIGLNFGLINSITVELKWRIRFCFLYVCYFCTNFVRASYFFLCVVLIICFLSKIFVILGYFPSYLYTFLSTGKSNNWSKQLLLIICGS